MADALRVLITDEDPDSRVETRKAVQRAELEIAAEVGLGTAAVSVALEARPDIILLAVEPPIQRPLETAEALANALPETPFIIYSSMNDPEAIRRSMVFGAREYIVKPVQSTRLLEAVNTVLVQEERRHMRRAGQMAGLDGRGSVITVSGAKGGIGKSVISVNLALALRRETGRSVVVLDADTEFGDVATLLDVVPFHTLKEVFRAIEGLDRATILKFVTSHSSGVDILAAPVDGDGCDVPPPETFKRIVDVLAQTYDFVVIDTPGSMNATVRACIDASTLTLIVTTGEVSSIRDTAIAMRRLTGLGAEGDKLKVLLNRGSRVNGFRMEDLKQAVGQDIFWELPFDKHMAVAVQYGQPVVIEGKSPGARNLIDLGRRIAGTKRSLIAQAEPRAPWGVMFGRWSRA